MTSENGPADHEELQAVAPDQSMRSLNLEAAIDRSHFRLEDENLTRSLLCHGQRSETLVTIAQSVHLQTGKGRGPAHAGTGPGQRC